MLHARLARWAEAAGSPDVPHLVERLRRRGIDAEAAVADVAVREPGRLPDWAQTLAAFVAAQEAQAAAHAPVERAHLSGVRAAQAMLPAIVRASPVEIAGHALAALAAQLGTRLTLACGRALDHEARLLPAGAPLDVSSDGWLDRFDALPGLAYLVGVVCANWRASTEELCRRLSDDWPLLVSDLWGGVEPDALVEFQGDAGDPHNGGRSVALLRFTGGRRAVYKTKDLRSGAAFMDLLRRVGPELRTFTILPRDGYGWEETIEPAACASTADVAGFYRRMGMLLRVLQLLEARDFWFDNLLADGGQPVFVDFETLLQPRSAYADATAAAALVEESVVPTGATSLRVSGAPGLQAEDIGALAPSRPLTTPFRFTLDALFAGAPQPAVDETGHVLWPAPPYAPVLDGMPVGVDEHVDDLVGGYREMHGRLLKRREGLARALAAFEGLPVRAILRDTFTCHRVIFAAGAPRLLGDGLERELALHRLFRTNQNEDVTWAEIDAFRALDVPFFLTRTDSADLSAGGGRIVESYFDGSAWGRLGARVAELAHFPVEVHVGLLRASLDAGERLPRPRSRIALDGDPLERAVARADDVLTAAIEEEDGSLSWVGLTYDPFTNARRVEPLRADLLTGTCGIAVLFAELYAHTGLDRFERGARSALEASRSFVLAAPGVYAGAPPAWILPCGGLFGVGAPLYALARCARALGDRGLAAEAEDAARALPFELFGDRSPGDLITGVRGLALALESGGIDLPSPERDRLRAALDASAGRVPPTPPGVSLPADSEADEVADPWNLSILWGLPGVAHRLLRLHDATVGSVRDLSPVGGFRA